MDTLAELLGQTPQKDRYRMLLELLGKRYSAAGRPMKGTFELTPYCTLDCKMCYVHHSSGSYAHPVLNGEQWCRVIDEAADAGMLLSVLTGGECFMHPQFREIYRHMKARGLLLMLLTNGTLLDEETVSWLAEQPPLAVRISVYGSCPAVYERVTGNAGAFEKVDRAIELLKAAGIRTDLQLTISRYNLEDFAALRAYATGKRCGTVNLDCDLFEPAEDTGRSLKTFALTEAEQTAVYLSASQAAGNPLRPSCDDDFAALARENSELRGTVPPGMPCAAGLRAFTVTYFGQMLPCACFPLATADLLQMDFEAAWSRIHAAAAEYTRSEECRSCVYFGKCKFCAARYYLASGGTAGHPGCVPCDKKLRALPRVMDEINQQQTKHKEETLL